MLLVTAERLLEILLKASFTAGVAFLVVAAARLALKRAPKRWSYIMWAVVFFRCLCPFSAESGVSVFNLLRTDTSGTAAVYGAQTEEYSEPPENAETENFYVGAENDMPSAPETQDEYEQYRRDIPETRYYRDGMEVQPIVTDGGNVSPAAEPKSEGKNMESGIGADTIFTIVWLCGTAAMALYGVISASRLAARVKTAVRTEEGVYESDRIATAFAAGILRPRIYIPCGIPENERRLIVMHERVHIRRRDYLVKLLAFAGLSLHWFNPLIWAAFALMTRDMEMSCDEAVLKKCSSGDRIPYAEALLRVSVRGFGAAAVVGFGETGVKERVKNVLGYKKHGRIAAVLAAAVMLASCAAAGTDAVTDNADSAADSRIRLEKGTTEFIDANGESISFAYGDNETASIYSHYGEERIPLPVVRYRASDGVVLSVLSEPVMAGNGLDFKGLKAVSKGSADFSGGLDIGCGVSEITVNDICVKHNDGFYYVSVSLDVLAEDTLPEKLECLTFASDHADIIDISGGDGRYTVNADIKACSDDGAPEKYGLVLLGFDDVPVYAAKNLNIAGHIDGDDEKNENRAPIEKGTTEFIGADGESVYFAYGENTAVKNRDSGESKEYTTLRYKDESGKIRRFWGTLESKGIQSAAFSTDISDGTSHFGSSGDFAIDCGISEITITEIGLKQRDGFYCIYMRMYILAEDTLPEKLDGLDWDEDTAEVSVSGGDGVYNVYAEIKTQWIENGRENFGLLLTGFDDVPVYASKELKIAGHIYGDTVKGGTGGAGTENIKAADGAESTNAERDENGDGFEYYIGLYDRNFALALREPFVVISAADDVVNDNETVWLIPVDKTSGVKGMGAEKFIINRNRVVTATFRIHCGDTVVKAPVDGEALWADGSCVVLDTEYGAVTYGDMKDVELKAGDKVSKGDALGRTAGSGYTGYAVQASIAEIPDSARFLNYEANAGAGSYTYNSSEARLLGGEPAGTGLLKPVNVNDMTEWFDEGDFYGSNINCNFLSGFADLSEMTGREKLVKKHREQEAKLAAEEIRLKQKEAEILRLSEEAAKAAQPADNSEAVLAKPCPADAEISEPYNAESAGEVHKGIDYRVDQGTEIYAAADGKIISCDDKQNGYGTCIIIDHGDGLATLYAHLSRSLVSLEDEVSAGDLIGYSGHTGNAFGNHLHFEVRQDGQHVDPLPYLKS